MNDILYIAVPCYNEEEVLPETSKRLLEKLSGLIAKGMVSDKSRILFIDDGSKDKTWQLIESCHQQNEHFSGIKLSRNRGHQNALLAGLYTAECYCDMCISMDADLQDDINAVDQFIKKYYQGCDIVYGVRSKRETDTFFKRTTAEGFYKVMKALGVDVVFNHADYRLMSRRALAQLKNFKEVNLFLRGIVPQIGFKTDIVTYERNERFAGESKYPLKKMLAFAFDGITSFSVKPIRLVTSLGGFLLFASLAYLLVLLILFLCGVGVTATLVLIGAMFTLGGIQLLALGIVGEYVGKIYSEVKERPKFIIDVLLNKE